MTVIELERDFTIDFGAPNSTILSNGNSLWLLFYGKLEQSRNIQEIVVINFVRCHTFKFGVPNFELLPMHEYGKLGIDSNSFYCIKESVWIRELMFLSSNHPNYNKNNWITLNHYVLTFRDNIFECVAEDYRVKKFNDGRSLVDIASEIVKKWED